MSIEQGLFQLIQADAGVSSLVNMASGKGLFWILAPKATSGKTNSIPFIVLGTVMTNDTYTTAGATGFREGMFQVDCYGSTYYESRAVAKAVRTLLQSYQGTLPDSDATVVNAVFNSKDWDMPYEEGPGNVGFIYRAMLEFRVWYRE